MEVTKTVPSSPCDHMSTLTGALHIPDSSAGACGSTAEWSNTWPWYRGYDYYMRRAVIQLKYSTILVYFYYYCQSNMNQYKASVFGLWPVGKLCVSAVKMTCLVVRLVSYWLACAGFVGYIHSSSIPLIPLQWHENHILRHSLRPRNPL